VDLYEWISRLTERKDHFKDEPKEWTPESIHRLKSIDNKISRDFDFWINNILRGFISEFAVDSTVSYNEVE